MGRSARPPPALCPGGSSWLIVSRDSSAQHAAVFLPHVTLCGQFVQLQVFVIRKTDISTGTRLAHHWDPSAQLARPGTPWVLQVWVLRGREAGPRSLTELVADPGLQGTGLEASPPTEQPDPGPSSNLSTRSTCPGPSAVISPKHTRAGDFRRRLPPLPWYTPSCIVSLPYIPRREAFWVGLVTCFGQQNAGKWCSGSSAPGSQRLPRCPGKEPRQSCRWAGRRAPDTGPCAHPQNLWVLPFLDKRSLRI